MRTWIGLAGDERWMKRKGRREKGCWTGKRVLDFRRWRRGKEWRGIEVEKEAGKDGKGERIVYRYWKGRRMRSGMAREGVEGQKSGRE